MRENNGGKRLGRGSDHGGPEHHGEECGFYSVDHSKALTPE